MGFFLLARELGVNTCCDERTFYHHELKRVHEFWKVNNPTSDPFQLYVLPGIRFDDLRHTHA